MAYLENQTVEINLDGNKYSVLCEVDWNGSVFNSDVYIESVTGTFQPWMFDKDGVRRIQWAVLTHVAQDKESSREYKAEMLGDESRGN